MRYIYLIILISILTGCQRQERPVDGSLNVVTTTGMLYDAVKNIAQDKVTVEALMGPGVDPHLYKATQGDLAKLNKANLIIYNGLMLEGKMGEILEKLSRIKPVYAAAESIPKEKLLSSAQYENAFDPHVWFDVSLWKLAVNQVSVALQQVDSSNLEFYQKNTSKYLEKLDSLDAFVKSRIAEIPDEQKILITAHDAFRYFGKAYDIRVEGLQGISTVSDFGLKDISRTTELIVKNDINAIFVETSVSDRAINAVISGCNEKGHNVQLGGYLYSDAMGEFGTYEGTYLGMFTSNVNTIVEALK